MKKLIFLTSLIIIISLMYISGCGNDQTVIAPQNTTVPQTVKTCYTEHDFVSDQTIAITPNQTAVTFLEPKDAVSVNISDTEETGVDKIPVIIPVAYTFNYSIRPDDTSIEKVIMKNKLGEQVFQIDSENPSVSIYLHGTYDIFIYSGYTVAEADGADHRAVFFYSPSAPESSEIGASYSESDLSKLLSTGSCPGGDLTGADLSKADISEGDLSGAKLNKANLTDTMFFLTDLSGANLTDVIGLTADQLAIADNIQSIIIPGYDMSGWVLRQLDFTKANLKGVNFSKAQLNVVNFTGANLTEVKFDYADCCYAIFKDATVSDGWDDAEGLNLKGATMPDGSTHPE